MALSFLVAIEVNESTDTLTQPFSLKLFGDIEAHAQANPEQFRRQAAAVSAYVTARPAERQRRHGRMKPLELTRQQADAIVRAYEPHAQVCPRLADRAPRGRKRSSRQLARAPSRLDDPDRPHLDRGRA